jgi:predicted ATP-grasp superfamily ATP-dependent carboligase
MVTESDYRALGVVRSLGRRRIPVWVLVQDEHRLAAFSRYAGRCLIWPVGDELSQVAFLQEQAERNSLARWLLIPTDDDTVALVGRHQNHLAEFYRLTSPAWEVLRWASDKRLTCQLARELGLAIPWTACPKDREELEALDCPFPAILKPATREGINQVSRAKAWRVGNRGSLLERYERMSALWGPDRFMVQEIIPGWGEAQFSYAALCEEGRPLASVVARRTRQIPMDFGRFSTFVETVDEPGVVEPAVRLLTAMRLTGLVEVE